MVEDRKTESELPKELRKWALESDFAQREQNNGIHPQMAVYIVAEEAFHGNYGTPIHYGSLDAQVERVTKKLHDSEGNERINLYARAWITMNQVLKEEGIEVCRVL